MSAASGVYTDGSGNVLDLNGYDSTVAYFRGGGGGDTVLLGANKLTIAYNGSTPQSSAIIITGTGGITKTGTGTQVLTGANTYSGLTAANGGTLELGSAAQGTVFAHGASFGHGFMTFDYSGSSGTLLSELAAADSPRRIRPATSPAQRRRQRCVGQSRQRSAVR